MTELELIERAKNGDEKAFAELINQHRDRIWGVCLSITRNHHDAEDALARTLYLLWTKLDRFHGKAGFGTWVYRVASNAAKEVVRKRKDEVSYDATMPDEPAFEFEDPNAEFVEQLVHNEVLLEALNQLDELPREAIVLHEVAGLPVNEIARQQDSSVDAVKQRLSRGRKKLRQLLPPGTL